MKLRNIFGTLAAVAAIFSSCAKEQLVSSIDGFDMPVSYVKFAQSGGSKTLEVTTGYDWSIDTTGTSKLFTVSPVTGSGNAKITITAPENKSSEFSQEIKMKLTSGNELVNTKYITVSQLGSAPAPATIKDVMTGADGKAFNVTATVNSIVNKHYGNFYINDGTYGTDLYIYGVLDKKGNEMTSTTAYDVLDPSTSANAWDLQVGDIVTLTGIKTTYSGTIEFANATIEKITKSLLDVEPIELSVEKDGGLVDVVVKYKGQGLDVLPQEDWIRLGGIQVGADSTIVSLSVAANEGGPRSGLVKIASSIPGQNSSKEITVVQEGSTTPINEVVVGAPCFVAGTVTAMCAAGFVITDATGSILYYQSKFANPKGYEIGDKVEVTCSKATAYNGALEIEPANVTKEVKVGHEDVTYPAPAVMGRYEVEDYLASCDGVHTMCKYVKVCGKMSVSGNYYNILFGESEKQGSLYQATDAQKALFENGKYYEISGYLIGYSKSSGVCKFANFLVLDAKELNPTKTFAEIISGAAAGNYSCEATVLAVGSNQVALTDGTDYMFMYNKAKDAKVGTKVLLNGAVTKYNGCWEWNDPAFYITAKDVEVKHPAAVDMNEAEFNTQKTASSVKYYKVVGTKGTSGYNVTGTGFTVNPYSNFTINPGDVTMYGYSIGYNSKSSVLNFVVASVQQ